MTSKEQQAKLRWSCRRGMLELDVILTKFLDHAFLTATSLEQAQFAALLNCSDQDLFVWLMGREIPPDPALVSIVEKVRGHAQLSF